MTSASIAPADGTWSGSYTYDGMGNRTSATENGVTSTYTLDAQGWPVSMDSSATVQSPDVRYSSSAAQGSTTPDGANPDGGLESSDDLVDNTNDQTFTYDSWGDTSAATKNGASVTYTLDALGRAVSRTSGSTTSFFFTGDSEDLAKTTTGSSSTLYAFTPGGPLASKTGTSTSFLLPDLHGDVVGQLPAGTSALSSTTWYSAFGQQTALSGSTQTLGYQGDWTDATTGTVDMGARDYLPSIARFTSEDPLLGNADDPPSLNQFVYGQASPILNTDPSGLCPVNYNCHDWGVSVAEQIQKQDSGASDSSDDSDSSSAVDDAVSVSVTERLTAVQVFFSTYSACVTDCRGGDLGFGQAVYSFEQWEYNSGRLSLSDWWRAVNGRIVRNIERAHDLLRSGQQGHNVRILAWMAYARRARSGSGNTQQMLWRAHQMSLHAGIRAARGLYTAESETERAFIDDVVVRNVDASALAGVSSRSGVLGAAVGAVYPDTYPISARSLKVLRYVSAAYQFETLSPDQFDKVGVNSTIDWSSI